MRGPNQPMSAQEMQAALQAKIDASAAQIAALTAQLATIQNETPVRGRHAASPIAESSSSARRSGSALSKANKAFRQRQLFKALGMMTFEGKLDSKAVVEYTRRVTLLGYNMGLRPARIPDHNNGLIQIATGWFADEAIEWFVTFLEDEFGTSLGTCEKEGYPFTWSDLSTHMVARFSPANAKEESWRELADMDRRNYPNIHAFHQEFILVGIKLGFTPHSETRGGRAFDIYKAKMMKDELMILRSVIAVQNSTGQTTLLNDMMRIVEDSEVDRRPSQQGSRQSNHGVRSRRQTTHRTQPQDSKDKQLRGSSNPVACAQMDPDTASPSIVSHDQCMKCRGYGHWAKDCSTPDNWQRRGGLNRGRETRGGRVCGRYCSRGGRTQANQVEEIKGRQRIPEHGGRLGHETKWKGDSGDGEITREPAEFFVGRVEEILNKFQAEWQERLVEKRGSGGERKPLQAYVVDVEDDGS
jgi:hypothetical protein